MTDKPPPSLSSQPCDPSGLQVAISVMSSHLGELAGTDPDGLPIGRVSEQAKAIQSAHKAMVEIEARNAQIAKVSEDRRPRLSELGELHPDDRARVKEIAKKARSQKLALAKRERKAAKAARRSPARL